METNTCCAYNATRGCPLSSKVFVADSARQPLKVLKVLLRGLALDAESGLWLTPLVNTPQMMRLFPFDLVYLDSELKVILGLELFPEVPFPRFSGEVASALILPLYSLESSGTQPGDQLLVCAAEEMASRVAEIAAPEIAAPEIAPPSAGAPAIPSITAPNLPVTPPASGSPRPFSGPRAFVPMRSGTVAQGTGFTVSLTTSWQITNSTMSAVLPEPIEAQEEETASQNLAVPDIAVEDTESAEQQEEEVAISTVSDPISEPVSDTASDPETPAEVAGGAHEELSPPAAAIVADEPNAVAAAPEAAASALEVVEEKKLDAVEWFDQAEKPEIAGSGVPPKTAPAVERASVQPASNAIGTAALVPQRQEPAKNVPAAVVTSTDADRVIPKKTSSETKKKEPKEPLGTLVKRWLNCPDPLPERRSIIRLLSRELVAYSTNPEKTKPYEVRDVSPTGLYLRTEERWKPGDVVSLLLQRKGATEKDHEKHVTVELKAVRCDEGGVGLTWVWPEGVEFAPWKRVHTKRSDETDADYFLRELRLTSALEFLRQICLPAAEETRLSLHRRLSNKRVASAVEIALKAQELPGRPDPGAKVHAHPDMVRRILENGSWTEDDWIRQWWAGLLVSSCSADGLDTSNSVFIDMLAKLMPVHLRVLSFVCRKAAELIAAGEPAATLDLYCTAEELIEAVGSPTLARIQQTMGQLSSMGLLAENNKPSYVAVTDKVKTRATPTALGLKMYARCNGHR